MPKKKIIVKPQQRLSYQFHQFRNELWMIVSGTAKIFLNDKEIWNKVWSFKDHGKSFNEVKKSIETEFPLLLSNFSKKLIIPEGSIFAAIK